ncbi:hypothetical protein Tco_0173411 [Tanacetum coccineum]
MYPTRLWRIYFDDPITYGICPFLQTRLLRNLQILGHVDADASDFMNDVLAQVHLKNLKEMKLIRDVLVLIVRHMHDKVQNVIVSVCYMEAEHTEKKHEEPTMEPEIERDDKEYESDKQETSFDDNETEQHDNQITRNEKNRTFICFFN